MNELNKIVADNIIRLRTEKKLTQAELAEQLNYTDKSISKWERGESLPSIEILIKLGEIFGVSIDFLVSQHDTEEKIEPPAQKKISSNKLIVALLADVLVWIVSTLIYICLNLAGKSGAWLTFIWAVPISTIVLFIFNAIWGERKTGFVLLSIFVWTLLISIYLQFLNYNIWPIFTIGIPLQIAIILWSKLKKRPKKQKVKKVKKEPEVL